MATIPNYPLAVSDLIHDQPTVFDQEKGSFIQTTMAYMMNTVAVLNQFMTNSMHLSTIEGSVQQDMTNFANNMAMQSAQDWAQYDAEQSAQTSDSNSLGIISYVIDGFMALVSIAMMDPVLFTMTTTMIVMQATGLQDKLENALPSNAGLKALCELGIAAGEAAVFGGVGAGADAIAGQFIDKTVGDAASQAAKTMGQKFLSGASKFTGLLSQTLLMSGSFWTDAMKATGMDDEDAMIVGMVLGIGFCVGATFASVKYAEIGDLSTLLRSKLTPNLEKALDHLAVFANLGRSAAQLAGSAYDIHSGILMKEQAEIMQMLAPVMASFAKLQGLLTQWSTASNQTQSAVTSVEESYQDITKSFRAFATMFRAPTQLVG